jgi:hypothetical protein
VKPPILAVVALVTAFPARAQLMLPGAIHSAPSEGTPKATGNATSAEAAQGRPKPNRVERPSESTLLGRDLVRDGATGMMVFRTVAGKGLEISNLSLAGEEVGKPGAPCRVDVVANRAIEATFEGRSTAGLSRYAVQIEACPFAFEVLEGAVLVERDPKTCTFAAAGCLVDPTGLWGPRGDAIEARQIEQFERARAKAEANMRESFRALVARAGKDKDAVKDIAGEQAGFSAARSMACSTYAGEAVHGFCALRLTEARAVALQARRDTTAQEKNHKDKAPEAAAAQATPRKNPAP